MIKQLTHKQYLDLAVSALKAAGVDASNYSEAEIARAIGDCRRVHRLLAVDGKVAEDLTPSEQVFAAAFKDLKLAVDEEIKDGIRTGNLVPAVDVTEVAPQPDAPAASAPKAKTGGKAKPKGN